MAKPLAKLLSILTPKRRWAQFSLFTMFVVVTVLCVWLSVVVYRANRQQAAVAAIEAMGGQVKYNVEKNDKQTEAFPKSLLRRWLPRKYIDHVVWVDFRGSQLKTGVRKNNANVTDAVMSHLQALLHLQGVVLDGTQVTDAGLAQLDVLTGLRELHLDDTQVTDAGLAHLRALTGLETLWLRGDTRVTDAGLSHLQAFKSLRGLYLDDTQVTDAGLANLRVLVGLQELRLLRTQVTDAGLVHLQGLTGLKELHLVRSRVTRAGVAKFQEALPKCWIVR